MMLGLSEGSVVRGKDVCLAWGSAWRKRKPSAAVLGCWKASSRANSGLFLDFTTAEYVV